MCALPQLLSIAPVLARQGRVFVHLNKFSNDPTLCLAAPAGASSSHACGWASPASLWFLLSLACEVLLCVLLFPRVVGLVALLVFVVWLLVVGLLASWLPGACPRGVLLRLFGLGFASLAAVFFLGCLVVSSSLAACWVFSFFRFFRRSLLLCCLSFQGDFFGRAINS